MSAINSLGGRAPRSSIHSRYLCLAVILAGLWIAGPFTEAAVWPWSIEVKGGIERLGPAMAFLWIPPDCERVRGVVLAQHNMEEISILENKRFRKGLSDLGLAEVWCSPGFDRLFRFNQGSGETFNGMMADLAAESGYRELTFVPVVGIGHSAAASWPYYFAAWNPGRTLAALSVSGQWPYFRDNGTFAPDIWGDRTVDYVPCLETMGEYESAATWSSEGLKERREHPLMPLSMLACPAEGHFASSDKKAEYLVLYLKKAGQYRMPRDWNGEGPPTLIPIDPTKTGWLADKWRLNLPPTAPAAPVGQYKGDPNHAFWFFDEETAKATEAYQATHRGKKAQLLGYVQDGNVVEQSNTHQQVKLRFQPLADGVTFRLTGTFLDQVPGGSPRPANWTGMPAGSQIGHAPGSVPISIDRICGPFEKIGPETFRVGLCRGQGEGLRSYDLWFAATHPGDDKYKPAVQQAQMDVPLRNAEGREQYIHFPQIQDQKVGTQILTLNATSDAGEKVHYYVLAGPAEVEGDTLRFTPIPPRSRFPVKVTVVAWQYGRSIEPRLKTADPVVRSFLRIH